MNDQIMIGRQPIVDLNGSIIGYELLFRSYDQQANEITDERFATAKVVTDALHGVGLDELIGNKSAFINVDKTFLLNPAIEAIPTDRFIFEILETVHIDEEVLNRVKQLHEQGFVFALDDLDFSQEQFDNAEKLLPYISIIKVDLIACGTVDAFRDKIDFFKGHNIELLAEKVEDQQQYAKCLEHGFSYFQGYFFAKPEIIESKKVNPNRLAIVKVIKHIIANEPPAVIEEEIVKSPEISINLLRYLNSASFGIKREINSIKQAISLLGMQPLMKLMTLLLYSIPDENAKYTHPLLETVLVRAELMKQLMMQLGGKEAAEKAYFTGMISMLDAILNNDMENILKDMSFSDDIQKAVLNHEEQLGEILKLAKCLESNLPQKKLESCHQLKINKEHLITSVNNAYMRTTLLMRELSL